MALLIIPVWQLEVRTATYRPGIDQSQHVKSVSHIISSISLLLSIWLPWVPETILAQMETSAFTLTLRSLFRFEWVLPLVPRVQYRLGLLEIYNRTLINNTSKENLYLSLTIFRSSFCWTCLLDPILAYSKTLGHIHSGRWPSPHGDGVQYYENAQK